MIIEGTSVFATSEETEAVQRMMLGAWSPGDVMMVFECAEWERKADVTARAQEACHALALKHGLPEIKGFYGLAKNGEFVEAKHD